MDGNRLFKYVVVFSVFFCLHFLLFQFFSSMKWNWKSKKLKTIFFCNNNQINYTEFYQIRSFLFQSKEMWFDFLFHHKFNLLFEVGFFFFKNHDLITHFNFIPFLFKLSNYSSCVWAMWVLVYVHFFNEISAILFNYTRSLPWPPYFSFCFLFLFLFSNMCLLSRNNTVLRPTDTSNHFDCGQIKLYTWTIFRFLWNGIFFRRKI